MTMQSSFPWNGEEKPLPTLKDCERAFIPSLWSQKAIDDFERSRKKEETLGDYIDRYNKEGAGIKYDQGKLQWDLMPFDLLEEELRVWMFGAKKYEAHNWRKGMPMTQGFNALMRHLVAFMNGEDKDPESGETHLAHAACCLKMMQNTYWKHPYHDDRYKVTKE